MRRERSGADIYNWNLWVVRWKGGKRRGRECKRKKPVEKERGREREDYGLDIHLTIQSNWSQVLSLSHPHTRTLNLTVKRWLHCLTAKLCVLQSLSQHHDLHNNNRLTAKVQIPILFSFCSHKPLAFRAQTDTGKREIPSQTQWLSQYAHDKSSKCEAHFECTSQWMPPPTLQLRQTPLTTPCHWPAFPMAPLKCAYKQ